MNEINKLFVLFMFFFNYLLFCFIDYFMYKFFFFYIDCIFEISENIVDLILEKRYLILGIFCIFFFNGIVFF